MTSIQNLRKESLLKLSMLFPAILFCFFSFAQTVVPAGEVNGTWAINGSPYLITGDIGIPADQALTIEPGVRVEFQGHYKFSVQGHLLAVGSYYDTIMFTINDSSGFHDISIPDGGWGGLRFGFSTPGDDTSRITYCIFAFGKANGDLVEDKKGGAIAVMEYPNLVISNTAFYSNAALDDGGAIAVSDADITLEQNFFYHNRSVMGNGGAVAIHACDVNISKTYFIDNRASNSGGAIALYYNANGLFSSNLMAGNFATYGGAFQIQNHCSPVIQNNLMYSNVAYEEGGGADIEDNSQATFINNTITGNFALFGGGIDVEVNSSPVFRNDIIWDNTAFVDGSQIHLFSEDSDPDFYYCDIEGGTDSIGTWYGGSVYLEYTGTYENNLDVDPNFIDEGYLYYLLDDESGCIDAGDPDIQYDDLEDLQNPGFANYPSKGTLQNDMGCYGGPFVLYFDFTTGITDYFGNAPINQDFLLYQNVPNPVKNKTTINYELLEPGYTLITLMDLQGREVLRLVEQFQVRGLYQVELDVRNYKLKNGVYLYSMQFGNSIVCKKLIVLRP